MKLTKIYTCFTTYGGVMEPCLRVTDYEVTGAEYFGHQEHGVDIDVAEPSRADAMQSAVEELRAKQTQHRAEISKIEDRIKSMLCLEHKAEA